jgi:hypothetical protein
MSAHATKVVSTTTLYNGNEPEFVENSDQVLNILKSSPAPQFYRQQKLMSLGALAAQGTTHSVWGFTLISDFMAQFPAITAPAGDGTHMGSRDFAALCLPQPGGGGLDIYFIYLLSADAYQECMGSEDQYNNAANSGIDSHTQNADSGWFCVENPKDQWSVALYRLAGSLTPVQVQAAYPTLIQQELASKVKGVNTTTSDETTDQQQQALAAAQAALAAAQNQAQINQINQQINQLNTGGTTTTPPGTPPPPGSLQTWELIGRVNGQLVPFSQAANNNSGSWQLVPGGTVSVGNAQTDGYQLAGTPGQWPTYYPGQDPSAYGLDPGKGVLAMGATVGSGQQRPYAVPANLLQDMFGPNWRQVVYNQNAGAVSANPSAPPSQSPAGGLLSVISQLL